MKSHILFKDSYILVKPSYRKTEQHKHPMLHIFVSKDICRIIVNNEYIEGNIIIADGNIKHTLPEFHQCDLFALIDPTSMLARNLQEKYLQGEKVISLTKKELSFVDRVINKSEDEMITEFDKLLDELGVNNQRSVIEDERIARIYADIENGKCLNLSVKEMAQSVYLSESRLLHLFREQAGISLKKYILLRKMEYAYKMVQAGENVTRASMEAGFSSPAHLAFVCKKHTGISISEVLKR